MNDDDDENANEFRQSGLGHPIMLLACALLFAFWALVAWLLWRWLA